MCRRVVPVLPDPEKPRGDELLELELDPIKITDEQREKLG
jgi:hypothetical protein